MPSRWSHPCSGTICLCRGRGYRRSNTHDRQLARPVLIGRFDVIHPRRPFCCSRAFWLAGRRSWHWSHRRQRRSRDKTRSQVMSGRQPCGEVSWVLIRMRCAIWVRRTVKKNTTRRVAATMTKNPAENMRQTMTLRLKVILARMTICTTLGSGSWGRLIECVYLTGIGTSIRMMSEEILSTKPRINGVPSSKVHCSANGFSFEGCRNEIGQSGRSYCPDSDSLASRRGMVDS